MLKVILAIAFTASLTAAYVGSELGTGTRDNMLAPVEFMQTLKDQARGKS